VEDKINREAAMAVGETSGQARPRRIVSAGGGRRRPELTEPGVVAVEVPVEAAGVQPPVGEAPPVAPPVGDEPETTAPAAAAAPAPAPAATSDDPLERLLAEEEEIERRTRDEHHDVPHFRKETD
jgi:small subunit ribosomal protein S3